MSQSKEQGPNEPTPAGSPDSRLGEHDRYLFCEGTHERLYELLGAHVEERHGKAGCSFAVWAPNAARVSVVGDFNGWTEDAHPMVQDQACGVWHTFIEGVSAGAVYKYDVLSRLHGYRVHKADPFAFRAELPPATGSVVCKPEYEWTDQSWMGSQASGNALAAPWSIYEVHLGSWRRGARARDEYLSYRDLAESLCEYVLEMGFTHVELLPVLEHPFYPSWGYQCTGYFAPTSRYGSPEDFMYLVDRLHRAGIGVILDWVPSHFPSDAHGLGYFDGTYLYEHADPRQRIHPDWESLQFNYGRHEVRSFLLSSAHFWLERYHLDALRVDAVASMLYLDYSRDEGEWIPNRYGGREDLDAISFLRLLNRSTYGRFPNVQTIAEESTSWPMVSRPIDVGGLGFGMKWDMGWMHDTLAYFRERTEHRGFHHEKLTFRGMYAHSENFVLPLSHDEVVHGKGSLLTRMPGDDWQQFANLRLLYGYMWALPGKPLLFMGGELAQRREWAHEEELEWFVLDHPLHKGVQRWVRDLNAFLRETPALYELDFEPEGFEWVNCENSGTSVISFLRKGRGETKPLLAVYNFGTTVHHGYRIGVPEGGTWKECLNSDSEHYGGSGQGNLGAVQVAEEPWDSRPFSLSLTVPALAAIYMVPEFVDQLRRPRKANAT